jgi:hypothetical protein
MRPSEALCGSGGELVMVRVVVTAKDLEETLETLAELDFPVNPELFHRGGGDDHRISRLFRQISADLRSAQR